jgi:hypothetical protein
MSQLGQTRPWGDAGSMSELPPESGRVADIPDRQLRARKRHSRNRHGAVILHGKFQPPVQAPQANLCSACSSVACIAQSLLRDAKEAERHVLRQCIGNVAGVHIHSNWTLREALALGFQRFDQAEVFEDGGMEAIRKACMSSLSCASG